MAYMITWHIVADIYPNLKMAVVRLRKISLIPAIRNVEVNIECFTCVHLIPIPTQSEAIFEQFKLLQYAATACWI